jgi:glycosyltransferase involved in cell wall biosynthesis
MKPTVSVVVIARNEQNSVARVVGETCGVLPGITSGYEILVNDDASTDGTSKILDELKRRNNHIHVYHQKKPLGIARGLEFLYQKARCQYVFILPGDGQWTAADLPEMLIKAERGYDIVVGKRIQKLYTVERKIISYLFNGLTQLLFNVETFDAGSTKLYRKTILKTIIPISRGVYNEAERIVRASYAGYMIGWVPVHHFGRSGGRASGAKLSLVGEAAVDMLRLWFLLRIRRVSPVTMKTNHYRT